jgi:hypothetical protein
MHRFITAAKECATAESWLKAKTSFEDLRAKLLDELKRPKEDDCENYVRALQEHADAVEKVSLVSPPLVGEKEHGEIMELAFLL